VSIFGGKSEGYPVNFIKTNKYNLLNFLPINLFQQFSKMANFYFLIIVVLSLIPTITAGGASATIMALALVVGISVIKDAYEDYLKSSSDKEENNRMIDALPIASSRHVR
jgi:magnesium-transporting ATPase (P-type)